MYAEQRPHHMTEADYLASAYAHDPEGGVDGVQKYEYRAGEVIAMVGGTVNHGLITASASRLLGNQLDDGDCAVTSPDVRLHIAHKQARRHPDVTVF